MTKESGKRDTYIPFAAAAKITRLSEKRIRNWLDNQDVYLDAEEFRSDPAKHRRFSRLDIARLGLVGRLTTLGFSAERASWTVEYHCLIDALYLKGARKEEEIIAEVKRKKYDVPEFAYNLLLRHQRKIAERFTPVARDLLKPDPLTLGHVEKIFKTSESEILDALRDSVLIVEVIGYEDSEHWGEAGAPNYLTYVRNKREDPMKTAWPSAIDTRVVVEVWRMMRDQDDRLKDAGLD